jgi:proline iminopeptidase
MSDMVKSLYPECKQYRDEMLKVSPIHHVYFEECGNKNGVPVIFLHGGPGSGCSPTQRRFFDPAHYRIILLDQRGCGRSTPPGEVGENTTNDLVSDIESIRHHLGIARWHVFGGSWGSTLALAYALAHTEQVMSLVLRGIFLSRQSELNWFLGEVKNFHPQPWHNLCEYLPAHQRSHVLQAFAALVFSDDKNISIPAATAWNAYESSMMSLLPREASAKTGDDKTTENKTAENKTAENITAGEVELARARVQIHYIKHLCFVGERDMLGEAAQKLAHIPTTIVQGRYDMVCPPVSAWELSRAMPHADFVIVPDAGHSAMEVGITSALVAATDNYKILK